jgi:hypothetical protein
MDDTILDTLMDSIHHDFKINPMLERKLRKVCVLYASYCLHDPETLEKDRLQLNPKKSKIIPFSMEGMDTI